MRKFYIGLFFIVYFIITCGDNDKNEQLQKKDQEITDLKNKLAQATSSDKDQQIKQKNLEITNLKNKFIQADQQIKQKDLEITNLKSKLTQSKGGGKGPRNGQNEDFNQAIKKLKQYRNNLNTKLNESESYYYNYKLPDDILENIDFTKNDFKDLKILGDATNNVLKAFTYMAVNILGKFFSTPELINQLVQEVVNNQYQKIEEIIIKYLDQEINEQAKKQNRNSALITFYFISQQGTPSEQENYIKEDLKKLLYKKDESKKLWLEKFKDYIEAAIDAGKKHSPEKKFIKWEDIK